ncbi:MAG TPA: hypothetical protein VJJ47_02165 [Candidatus Paceibacterota bacterium]
MTMNKTKAEGRGQRAENAALSSPLPSALCPPTSPGFTIPQILVIGAITVSVVTALAGWLGATLRQAKTAASRELAFQVAEAGVEYYRWHLAHAPSDFEDGTGEPGPYVHDFLDRDGVKIGEFSLEITPPATGSTRVTIASTGTLVATTTATTSRTVRVEMAKPSFARYSILSNANVRIGAGTVMNGPVHSNGGIRFDGLATNLVTSARDVYDDPDHSGGNEFGVHTHASPADPLPPAIVPSRPDIFQVGRQFPLPAVDFAGVAADLAGLKASAQSGGRYYAASGKSGWHIILKSNSTFDLYKVTAKKTPPSGCYNDAGETGWDTWEIKTEALQGNYAFPGNGVMFFEDFVWVEGAVPSGARLIVGAATFPDSASTRKSIIINKSITYGAQDGTAVLGLVAQNNVSIGLPSDNVLNVHAALIAQNGRVGRNHYRSACGASYVRSTINIYGAIASNLRYGFAWTDNTGYTTRNITYDANLLYGPPPEFPLSAEGYEVLSWENVEN